MPVVLVVLGSMFAMVLAVFAIVYIAAPLFKGAGWLVVNFFRLIGLTIAHVFRFIGSMLRDSVRAVGAVIATVAFVPLVLLNIIIGRWSASAHFGRAVQDEVATFGHCVYSVAIAHPLRLLLLHGLLEGIETRVPEAVANAPGSDKPSKRTGAFEGYTIVGSLKTGGSGGKLYVAEPDETKAASFERAGVTGVSQVVIKSFSIRDGSSMPQIVRESRALEAARKLGLVLEHEMTDERFFYVMRYVPGEDLATATRRLHSPTGTLGLTTPSIREATGYIADLLETLQQFHSGGLWHKDVKPDNIIVHNGNAHLVDFGLITPLYSGMTLTTHGTEYFRDPELVRMALRGAKVHEVDGVKFDIYGAGAVLFSVIENSFPAHGGLSQITKRCPEALRWIVRRAMADLNKRYPDSRAMLADLRVVQNAEDPFTLRPADLPSMRGESTDGFAGYDQLDDPAPVAAKTPEQREWQEAAKVAHQESPVVATPVSFVESEPEAVADGPRTAPKLRVTDWITGRYDPSGVRASVARKGTPTPRPAPVRESRANLVPVELRAPAREQLKNARERAANARKRVDQKHAHRHGKRGRRHQRTGRFSNEPNAGVVVAALFFFIGTAVIAGGGIVGYSLFNHRMEEKRDLFPGTAIVDFGSGKTYTASSPEDVTRRADTRAVSSSSSGRTYTVGGSGSLLSDMLVRLERAGDRPVLVISEFENDSDDPTFDTLVTLVNELIAEGRAVQGLSGSDHDTDLIAQTKKVVGLSDPTEKEARRKLERWLSSDNAPLGGVIWAFPDSPWQFIAGESDDSRDGFDTFEEPAEAQESSHDTWNDTIDLGFLTINLR